MRSFGGLIGQFQDIDTTWLQALASSTLADLNLPLGGASLQVENCARGGQRVLKCLVRGRWLSKHPRWHFEHSEMAERLSQHLVVTVHSFACDETGELVASFANGRQVGGDSVTYDDESIDETDSEQDFAVRQSRWPLGHLSCILGIKRSMITEQRGVHLPLDRPLRPQPLWQYLAATPKKSEEFGAFVKAG
jgi:hypothetical protein